MNRIYHGVAYFILIGFVVFSIVELFVRTQIVPKDFLYFEVNSGEFPFYKLVKSYQEDGITIRNHRREYYPRGARLEKIAFVGDSVTFGSGLKDEETFVELVQKKQDLYDVYNYGVEGYGLTEISKVIDQVLESGGYRKIIYTFVFNDTYPAMAGLLPLMSTEENRFSTIERYQGAYGVLKLFLKDYAKSIIVLKGIIGSMGKPSEGDRVLMELEYEEENDSRCSRSYEYMKKVAQNKSYIVNYNTWLKQYKDQMLLDELELAIRHLREKVESQGVELVVMVHYDFLTMDNGKSAAHVVSGIRSVLSHAGVTSIPSFQAYESNYKDCGFYYDAGHHGKKGAEVVGDLVLKYLLERN